MTRYQSLAFWAVLAILAIVPTMALATLAGAWVGTVGA